MNTQKNQRKNQPHKDRGDTMRRNKKDVHSSIPRDRGDVRKSLKKVSKHEIKSLIAESVQTDLVSRSTNTFAESLPLCFETQISAEEGSVKTLDFRKRIKDRYTFKRHQVLKNEDICQFNSILQCDVRNAPPKHDYEYVEKHKLKDFRDAKKSDKASVHRAVSAIKFKRSSKAEEAERKKMPPETEKNVTRKDRKPVIKTITSKTDTRVYKAVTFVDQTARKPLHIKIPKELHKPKSKIPRIIPIIKGKTTESTKRLRRRTVSQRSPSLKSADSLPTEIAKWVPESVDPHTKPYYDAWVSKTATASTKLLKEARIEKSKLLDRYKLEMRISPELVYKKFEEEEYAGRIRVRRRGEK
ncbi:uncharacterized protein LOC125239415 [Leguminivora glycinivorella]|uniref:uncharacterized protein LOC125239415 n=1 Tax=Leguminivora glycinivorella TaxID=1035111 RepID=UPI00200C5EE9|nr:uncharacterized protein LOC125239415 [Leguminivora glycinivorella]